MSDGGSFIMSQQVSAPLFIFDGVVLLFLVVLPLRWYWRRALADKGGEI